MSLKELAIRYHALENTDRNGFRRKARILQSLWREQQGFPIGTHSSTKGKRILGSRLPMPDAKTLLWNFISENIRNVVKREVLDPVKSKGKVFIEPRIFNDLLSSQPLCFNLFGELQRDMKLATDVLRAVSDGRIHEVTGIEFEDSPGRCDPRFSNDKSAFDVFVTFVTSTGGRGFVGIEVKYHEDLKDDAATHKLRYDEIATAMKCFRPESMECLKKKPLQQIWRDHLLAGILRSVGGFQDGYFMLLHPAGNTYCSEAVDDYRKCLNCADTFSSLTLDVLVSEIRNQTNAEWIQKFYDRYLDFATIDTLM